MSAHNGEEVKRERYTDAARLDWLERRHTLHNSVAILYVVTGYSVQVSEDDGNNLICEHEGDDLREAIDRCMEEVQ